MNTQQEPTLKKDFCSYPIFLLIFFYYFFILLYILIYLFLF